VHATLVETSLALYEIAFSTPHRNGAPALLGGEPARAGLFGILASALSLDWVTFVAYNEGMWRSATLTVSPEAYRALPAHIMPARLRDDFGLSYGDAERRAAERSFTWIRRLYPRLPNRLRLVGSYQEARPRLAGRHPDPATRLLNRIWIGRPRLAE
jgi:hypothetical protein